MSTATERTLAILDTRVLRAVAAWQEAHRGRPADRLAIAHELGISGSVLDASGERLGNLGLAIWRKKGICRDIELTRMGARVCLVLATLVAVDRSDGVSADALARRPALADLPGVAVHLVWMAEHGFCWEVSPWRYRAVGGL